MFTLDSSVANANQGHYTLSFGSVTAPITCQEAKKPGTGRSVEFCCVSGLLPMALWLGLNTAILGMQIAMQIANTKHINIGSNDTHIT